MRSIQGSQSSTIAYDGVYKSDDMFLIDTENKCICIIKNSAGIVFIVFEWENIRIHSINHNFLSKYVFFYYYVLNLK